MSKHLKAVLVAALALSLLAALLTVAHVKTTYRTSKAVLSGTPYVGQDFVVSGVITPALTAKSRAAVKVKLLMEMGDRCGVTDVYVAKLTKVPAGRRGTRYSRTLNIPVKGKHPVRVFQYREGMLVSTSRITHFEVEDGTDVQRISIDSDSHADVNAAAGKPMNVVRFPSKIAEEHMDKLLKSIVIFGLGLHHAEVDGEIPCHRQDHPLDGIR